VNELTGPPGVIRMGEWPSLILTSECLARLLVKSRRPGSPLGYKRHRQVHRQLAVDLAVHKFCWLHYLG
jgi:hypothetical protein